MDYHIELIRISGNIRKMRRERGLTVQELAYRCDIERSNLSRIESGRSNVTLRTLCIICDGLGTTIEELMNKDKAESRMHEPELVLEQ